MKLIKNSQDLLRKPCEKVSVKEGLRIAKSLFGWLSSYNKKGHSTSGIGVAAPQLGIYKQVAVMDVNGRKVAFVNPRIVDCSPFNISWTESCLSFPGVSVDTLRRVWVEVDCENWQDSIVFGPKNKEKFTNEELLESVCSQHEIGHVASLLMFDFQKEDSVSPLEWFCENR